MFNVDVRDRIKKARLYGYEIAEQIGITETSFSRKLARKELSEKEKSDIYKAIDTLSKQRGA